MGSQPFPSPGDLPYPGIEPGSSALQVDSLPTELSGKPNTNLELGGECSNGFLSDQSVPTNIFAGFVLFVCFLRRSGWLLTLPSAITFTSCVPYHTSSNQSCYCDWPRGDPMHTTSNAPGTRDWRKDYTSRPQHMRTSDCGPTQ